MALRIPNADGNLSSTTIFDTVANVPSQHATTNLTVSSGGITTTPFTAPNTTNKVTGVAVMVIGVPTSGSFVAKLFENAIDTGVSVTISASLITNTNTWIYFRLAVPYTYTTTVANTYRWKISNASGNGTLMADTGGTLVSNLTTDDRLGAFGATDDLWVIPFNQTGTRTITIDGTTQTIGSGTDTSTLTSTPIRSVTCAINLYGPTSGSAILKFDTSASSKVTVKGNIVIGAGGERQMGTVASPYPSAFTAQFIHDENGVSCNYGTAIYQKGRDIQQGSPLTYYKTKYTSGAGTAASPLVVADPVDWTVGDEILICSTGTSATNYQETESRFIITKNSSTSYVISTTAGGAEAALTYTHTTDAWILSVQRNVIEKTTNIAQAFYTTNISITLGDVAYKWARHETIGSSTANKSGITIATGTAGVGSIDYCVGYRPLFSAYSWTTTKVATTNTGLISYLQTTGSTIGAIFANSAGNKTFIDCFAVGCQSVGFELSASNSTFNTCYAIACNTLGVSTLGGFYFITSTKNTLNNCEAHCNRTNGIYLTGGSGIIFNNSLFGTKGTNVIDIQCTSNTFDDLLLNNCQFGSATLINNYNNMAIGSEVRMSRYQNTDNSHRWYGPGGSAQSTGAGLSDTTVRTPNSLGIVLIPEDATTGFPWSFQIPAVGNTTVNFQGYFQKSSAFGTDVCTIDLYLPGSVVPDATTNLTNTTGSYLSASVSAFFNSSVSGLATVIITAKSVAVGAYVYIDDLYNAGDTVTSYDKLTGLDVWFNGKPANIIAPLFLGGIAPAVWAVATGGLVSNPGTTGFALAGLITRANTAQAGASNSITLDLGASSINDFYLDDYIVVVGGTGAGQTRRISAYNGTTKVATCIRAWSITPDSTSVFSIIPFFSVENAVWEALSANHITAGTTGSQVKKTLTVAKYLALK